LMNEFGECMGQVTQASGAPVARSSHAVAIVGKKAYVFGGEFEPRVPLDYDIHVFDLEAHDWSVMEATGDKPSPRVGVAMAAVDTIVYVFAGRDKQHKELNEFYAFNTITGVWKLLSSGPKSPPHRSVQKSPNKIIN
jgi:N-acetylneuraminic acid mutarotase